MAKDTKKNVGAVDDDGFVSIGHDLYVWPGKVGDPPIQGWILDRVDHDAKTDGKGNELMPAYTQLLIRTTKETIGKKEQEEGVTIPAGSDTLVTLRHGIKVLSRIASLADRTTEVIIARTGDRPIAGRPGQKVATWECKVRPVFRPLSEVAPEYAQLRGFNTALLALPAPEETD